VSTIPLHIQRRFEQRWAARFWFAGNPASKAVVAFPSFPLKQCSVGTALTTTGRSMSPMIASLWRASSAETVAAAVQCRQSVIRS